MRSVWSQNRDDFEYIVVDGASSDGSKEAIMRFSEEFGTRLKWVSEPDTGIYNAMNKGIGMASGEYIQFLNSGDSLVSDQVVDQMSEALEKRTCRGALFFGIGVLPDRRLRFRAFSAVH